MANQKEISPKIITAIFTVFILGFALVWVLSGSQPKPLGSKASADCSAEGVVAAGNGAFSVSVNEGSNEVVAQATLNPKSARFDQSCDYAHYIVFTFTAPSGAAADPSVQATLDRSGDSVTRISGSYRSTRDNVFTFSAFPIADGTTITVSAYLVDSVGDDSLSAAQRIGSSQSYSHKQSATGGPGGGTGGPGGGGGTPPTYGTPASTPPVSGGGAGAAACDSERFQYDPATGLCLPKIAGGGLAGQRDVYALINLVIKIMLSFVGVLAVIFLIIGGYFYVTSAGNEEQAARGRRTILYALIGLAVVMLSFVIVSVVARLVSTGGT